jgi:hypothetical protein
MAFTEKQSYKIEVNEDFSVGVRRSDIVLKDEVEVGRTYHRSVLVPGSDVSAEHPEVQAVAEAVWTAEIVAAYEAALPVVEDGTESA